MNGTPITLDLPVSLGFSDSVGPGWCSLADAIRELLLSSCQFDRELRDRLRVGKWRIPPSLTRKVSHYSMVILPHVTVNTPSVISVWPTSAQQLAWSSEQVANKCDASEQAELSQELQPHVSPVFDSVDSVFCDPGRRQVLIIH